MLNKIPAEKLIRLAALTAVVTLSGCSRGPSTEESVGSSGRKAEQKSMAGKVDSGLSDGTKSLAGIKKVGLEFDDLASNLPLSHDEMQAIMAKRLKSLDLEVATPGELASETGKPSLVLEIAGTQTNVLPEGAEKPILTETFTYRLYLYQDIKTERNPEVVLNRSTWASDPEGLFRVTPDGIFRTQNPDLHKECIGKVFDDFEQDYRKAN